MACRIRSDTDEHTRRPMRLDHADARARLAEHDHGVLATMHEVRGVDAVPVVYAMIGELIGVPVDLVKPKSSTELQRERNLVADPRATLLVEHWDRDDWAQLWWARAELRYVGEPDPEWSNALGAVLAARFAQYREEPFAGMLVFRVVGVTGWSASVS
jgi:hypothetical protein